jgi:hypothetical protein
MSRVSFRVDCEPVVGQPLDDPEPPRRQCLGRRRVPTRPVHQPGQDYPRVAPAAVPTELDHPTAGVTAAGQWDGREPGLDLGLKAFPQVAFASAGL